MNTYIESIFNVLPSLKLQQTIVFGVFTTIIIIICFISYLWIVKKNDNTPEKKLEIKNKYTNEKCKKVDQSTYIKF